MAYSIPLPATYEKQLQSASPPSIHAMLLQKPHLLTFPVEVTVNFVQVHIALQENTESYVRVRQAYRAL